MTDTKISEMPTTSCIGCPFLSDEEGCIVPGGACIHRGIKGRLVLVRY